MTGVDKKPHLQFCLNLHNILDLGQNLLSTFPVDMKNMI